MVLYVKTYKVYLNHYVLVGNAYFYMLLLHIKEKKHTRNTNSRTSPKKVVKKKTIKIRAQNNEVKNKCTYTKPVFDSFNTLIILTNLWQY